MKSARCSYLVLSEVRAKDSLDAVRAFLDLWNPHSHDRTTIERLVADLREDPSVDCQDVA